MHKVSLLPSTTSTSSQYSHAVDASQYSHAVDASTLHITAPMIKAKHIHWRGFKSNLGIPFRLHLVTSALWSETTGKTAASSCPGLRLQALEFNGKTALLLFLRRLPSSRLLLSHHSCIPLYLQSTLSNECPGADIHAVCTTKYPHSDQSSSELRAQSLPDLHASSCHCFENPY